MKALNFQIEPLAEANVPGFRAVLDRVARERRYLAFLEAPTLAQTEEFAAMLRHAGFPQFVAIVDERVVGWCDISPIPRPTYKHAGVLGMGVIAEFRAHGIGTALLRAALAQARLIGLTRIELTVRARNQVAVALYRQFGFALEGTKRNAVRIDGVYEDLLVMALLYPEPITHQ